MIGWIWLVDGVLCRSMGCRWFSKVPYASRYFVRIHNDLLVFPMVLYVGSKWQRKFRKSKKKAIPATSLGTPLFSVTLRKVFGDGLCIAGDY